MEKVTVGPLPDKNWHNHTAFLLHHLCSWRESPTWVPAPVQGCPSIPAAKIFATHLILDVFLRTTLLSGEGVSSSLVLDRGWPYRPAEAYPGLGYNIWVTIYKHIKVNACATGTRTAGHKRSPLCTSGDRSASTEKDLQLFCVFGGIFFRLLASLK